MQAVPGELGKVSVPPLLLSFHTPMPFSLFLLISIAIFPSDLALKAAVPRRYHAPSGQFPDG